MFLIDISVFLFLWFTVCGLWHEVCHLLECERQHCASSYMWVNFEPLPSMHFTYLGYKDDELISLSGGLYASLLCFLMFFVTVDVWFWLGWCFFVLGWVQLFYGVFEWRMLRRLSYHWYTVGRYVLYVMVVLVLMVIYMVV